MSIRLIDLLAFLATPQQDEDEKRRKLFEFACRRVSERIGMAPRPYTGVMRTVSLETVGLAAMRYARTGGLVGDPTQHELDASWLFGLFGDLDAEGFTHHLTVSLARVLIQWYPSATEIRALRGWLHQATSDSREKSQTSTEVVLPNANDRRDKFICESMAKGKTRAVIRNEVNKRKSWETLDSEQAVSAAAKRYANRQGLPWPINRTS